MKYKPLSPHITIYNNEISSLYSIWHRITGVINVFLFCFLPLMTKAFNWGVINGYNHFCTFLFLYCFYFLCLLFLVSFYHMLNGYRHLSWDTNKFLKKNELTTSLLILLVGVTICSFFSLTLIL